MSDDELRDKLTKALRAQGFSFNHADECADIAVAMLREAEADEIDQLRAVLRLYAGIAPGGSETDPLRDGGIVARPPSTGVRVKTL